MDEKDVQAVEKKRNADKDTIIQELRSLGVRRVGPTHCTGDLARGIFAEEWGECWIDADLGARIAVGG